MLLEISSVMRPDGTKKEEAVAERMRNGRRRCRSDRRCRKCNLDESERLEKKREECCEVGSQDKRPGIREDGGLIERIGRILVVE